MFSFVILIELFLNKNNTGATCKNFAQDTH